MQYESVGACLDPKLSLLLTVLGTASRRAVLYEDDVRVIGGMTLG